ncbi:thiamine pyrophosphate-dependent enzyme [Lentibacillus sediminis]|uniref:thiamine pyrophosphate-dependent enzyme n=1 Tax=Lentibacillus sediminis TaxID=1940529 RepID=UPI000C1C4A21|nr:thiamine pyrophosphate-dependent enzyme [Lentibacillus sediminis]
MRLNLHEKKHLLEGMLRIRCFSERVCLLAEEGSENVMECKDTGKEAVATGISSVLRHGDTIMSTGRGCEFLLARGEEVHRLLAEGKGQGMHYPMSATSADLGIFGANVMAGVGAAFVHRRAGRGDVSVIHLDEGLTKEESVREMMCMAETWELPAVFVLEKRQDLQTSIEDSCGWVNRSCFVDGVDVLAVRETAWLAVERARHGGGPTWVECRLPPDMEKPEKHDPIVRLKAQLMKLGMSENDYYIIEGNVHEAIEQGVDVWKAGEAGKQAEKDIGTETGGLFPSRQKTSFLWYSTGRRMSR